MERIKALRGYEQNAVQVRYEVRLGSQSFPSDELALPFYYDQSAQVVYIREGLSERERQAALAQVLRKLLDLQTVQPAVFKELIADPRSANAILDENEIMPLPPDLNLAAPEASVEPLSLGVAEDLDTDLVVEVMPVPAPHPTVGPQHNSWAHQEILLFDEPSTNGHTPNGHRATTNGYSATTSKPAEQPLPKSEGKLELALHLASVTPGAKLNRQQIEQLLNVARPGVPLQALLVGRILWRICPQDSYTRQLVARHLTHCLGQLRAWEIANIKEAREWKQSLDEQSIAQLRQHCHTHRATHFQREQDLLALLQLPDDSALGLLLTQERQAFAQIIEHDLEQLMAR